MVDQKQLEAPCPLPGRGWGARPRWLVLFLAGAPLAAVDAVLLGVPERY